MRRTIVFTLLAILLAAQTHAQQPAPTLKSALEAAQKAAESRRTELLKTPAGVAFLEAQEVVRQLDLLVKAEQSKPAEKPNASK